MRSKFECSQWLDVGINGDIVVQHSEFHFEMSSAAQINKCPICHIMTNDLRRTAPTSR